MRIKKKKRCIGKTRAFKTSPTIIHKSIPVYCSFCSHHPVCNYKDKYEESVKKLFPLDIRCKFFKEYNDYPKGDWI